MIDSVPDRAQGSSIIPPMGDARLKEGERRTVTVLFSDMKGFTTLSEESDPEEIDQLMNRIFSRFESIINKHGGNVEKYIGDALVAVFGVPELHEDDPARAIDSALEFVSALRRMSGKFSDSIAFRTGIHTGLVTTGRRGEFEVVTGHTMAIAARLQTAAPANGVLVSAATREACEKQFIFGEVQELQVKGKHEHILAWPALARRKAMFDYQTPFVDRKRPLEQLTGAYIHHMRGESRGVYVVGDGGIGKTRLVAEFWARLKTFPNFSATFLAINPSLFGTYEYASVQQAVCDFLDIKPDISLEEYRERLKERINLAEEWIEDTWSLFSRKEHPGAESRFQAALAALFDAILDSDANTYPDVLFIDNAHLMDEKSLEFFRGYCGTSGTKPFIVLCDRIRHETTAGVFNTHTTLLLDPLDRPDARELAKGLDPDGLDEDALTVIVERAQGYPLFIEEYVKLARQDRDLRHLPESIQTTILAALERLDPQARDLAKRLSILRHPFDTSFAAAMLGQDSGDALTGDEGQENIANRLDRLVDERILSRSGDGLWTFKHSIVREAVHSSLLHHNRRVLHALAADYLQRHKDGASIDIFHHLIEAENWSHARAFLVETRPRLPSDYLPQLQLLIDHCPESAPGELIELYFIQYATNFNNRQFANLGTIVLQMYRLALQSRNRFYLARCYHLMMTTHYMNLDYHSAVLYGIKAVEAYEGGGNEKGAANARVFLSMCFQYTGRPDRARTTLEAIPQESPELRQYRAAGLASYYRMRGAYRETDTLTQELSAQAALAGEEDQVCHYLSKLVVDTLHNFQFEDALNLDQSGQNYCGLDMEMTGPFYAAKALALHDAGEENAASQAFQTAAYHLAQLREDSDRAQAHALVAWARLLAGHRNEARELALTGLEASVRSRHYAAMFECQTTLAEVALLEGNKRDFAFFVMDAAVLAGAPILRQRKTLIRYNYFAWLLLASETEPRDFGPSLRSDDTDEFITDAKQLLEEDLGQLRDETIRDRQLRLSVFGTIARA